MKIVKELSKTLKEFIKDTQKEMENIKKMIELRSKLIKKENEELKLVKEETNTKIQNIVNAYKELTIKQDAVERIIAEINKGYDNKAIITKNTNYENYKTKIKQMQQKITKSRKQQHTNINKAILFDRMNHNRARMVTKNDDQITIYKISISYKYNSTMYYIYFKNKWRKLRDVIKNLNKEGLIYGFKSIIMALKLRRYNQNNQKVNNTLKEENTPMDVDNNNNSN